MTTIPGTNYQVQGDNILAPDGSTISQDQFIQKVEAKEVSLTENSLRFLGSHFGPALENSLLKASGLQVSTMVLSNRMSMSEGLTGDLYSLMEMLAKATMDQKKLAQEVKHREADLQIDMMDKSADKALAGATVRMIAGVLSGVANIASGAMSIKGASHVLNSTSLSDADKSAFLQKESGLSKIVESVGQITHSSMELGAAHFDKDSKDLDAGARKMEQMAGESRDLVDSLREMNAKVREVLREIQSAENEASKTIGRM